LARAGWLRTKAASRSVDKFSRRMSTTSFEVFDGEAEAPRARRGMPKESGTDLLEM
jgi:hypothetical protein